MQRDLAGEEAREIARVIAALTGQRLPLVSETAGEVLTELVAKGLQVGYSQFNELMLLLGYDRVTPEFFQYLVDQRTGYESGSALTSVEQFRKGVDAARKASILFFGNVKYGFKRLSRNAEELELWISLLQPADERRFHQRHEPLLPIEEIPGEDTYYLGYLIEREIRSRLAENPENEEIRQQNERRKGIVERGIRNQEAYLTSDHLDVYIATSMRERHEYFWVNRIIKEIFNHATLKPLKLRWFDPTQAYCRNRIDKGLAEALMLKRAKCTIYFAQESDTLGKDSELASTLAQGKIVVAFVPAVDEPYVKDWLDTLSHLNPGKSLQEILLAQLRLFNPALAWEDPAVLRWVAAPQEMDLDQARGKLLSTMKSHYDKRANTLQDDHPLGMQVNLEQGVANGVLVVRSVADCVEIVRRTVLNSLDLEIDPQEVDGKEYLYLREQISGSVFRVVTGDELLTNSFWNFYLEP